MELLEILAVGFVAVLHACFMVLEMFLWTTPKGRKIFGLTPEFAEASRVLAANQGLYNGFLCAGLVWGISLGASGDAIKIFFLSCVVVAGIYGALTSSRKILFIQGVPGAVALLFVLLTPV